ncbi:rod shape-determining protein MreC [Alicyclobacillus ferrooxydans]|uniref:rod shape-determining protein MreC n=1 Tax=Alicyclobacillus ferrooxydans TaxID=471514 RepID=UPI0006D53C39|nr:rod shape-determining protein MreC [Alicyclobacillus ferrooxydans]
MRSRSIRSTVVAMVVILLLAGMAVLPATRRMLGQMGSSVGSVFRGPIQQYHAVTSDLQSLREMYLQNTLLKSQMQNYNLLQAKLSDLQAENIRLQAMIQFEKQLKTGWKLVPAHVSTRSAASWNNEFTIDVGTSNQIHANMVVISPNGNLVGRISNTTSHSATVVLITSPSSSDGVSSYIEDSTAPFSGVVFGSSQTVGMLDMQFISPLATIKNGDTVVTSGIGAIYPKGIVIGKVVSHTPGVQGLTQTAVIAPAAKLNFLQDVFVIQSPSS